MPYIKVYEVQKRINCSCR